MKKISRLFVSIVLCELVGFAGTPFTISAIPNWYNSLNKPFFAPPNWLFGPVWTVLYLLMGISLYLVWEKGLKKKQNRVAVKYFLAQLATNFIWTPIFFGIKSPALALVVILVLWVLIVMTMKKFYKISELAAYLLVPYLLWVSFATLLNGAIVVLN